MNGKDYDDILEQIYDESEKWRSDEKAYCQYAIELIKLLPDRSTFQSDISTLKTAIDVYISGRNIEQASHMIEQVIEHYNEELNAMIKNYEDWVLGHILRFTSKYKGTRRLLLAFQRLAVICVAALPFLLSVSEFIPYVASRYISIGISCIPFLFEIMIKTSGMSKELKIYSSAISALNEETHWYKSRLEIYQEKEEGERADIFRERASKIINKVGKDNFKLNEEIVKGMESELSKKSKN